MEQHGKTGLYRRVVKARLYIDDHYAEKIDLENISQQACFSKFHFIRLFKSVYGHTPKNYLGKVRVERAKEYLSKGYSVLETGYLVGMESPTSFAGLFKKITGETPSGFQKTQQERQKNILRAPLQFVPACFAARHGWSE